MFSGTMRTRDRRPVGPDRNSHGRDHDDKVTAIAAFERGPATPRACLRAGQIGKLWGLHDIQIGDHIGQPPPGGKRHRFAPPTLESVIVARRPGDRAKLSAALRQALRGGRHGRPVTDCVVTMFESGYSSPSTTAAHFRKLTPVVLAAALEQAGTVVCEPMIRVSLEIPAHAVGSVLAAAARLGAEAGTPTLREDLAALETLLPAIRAQDLQRQLPGLTGGEGVAETSFGGYRPVSGPPPGQAR